MTDAGLTARSEFAADAVATVDAGAHAPADLWQALATSDGFERALTDAVRDLLADVPHYERVRTLYDQGVTAGDGGYARLVAGLERPPESPVYERALSLTTQFGSGEVTPLGTRLPLDAIQSGPLAVFAAAAETPTVAVRLGRDFQDRRRDQREATCELLCQLGEVCHVAVVTSGLTARWLAREHRTDLPATFTEQCKSRQEPDTPVADQVETAHDALDADSREVRLLTDLAEEPGETLSYHALTAQHDVSTSRISQLLGTLEGLELVERYGPRSDQHVDLLPAGSEFIDSLETETTRQQRLDSCLANSGQSSHSDVLARPHTKGATDGASDDTAGASTAPPYRTRYLSRGEHAATVASATDGGITAVDADIDDTREDQRRTRHVSYDADRDEAVVAVHATTPLEYATSLALGLVSPRLFDNALPTERLDQIDDPPMILRDARCIGGLSNEALEDPQELRDNLVQWGEDLADMTTALRREEYDDRGRFCAEILRSAHGLAGTVIHLLDVCGVDVVRELRVSTSCSHSQLASLAKTVSISTAIQSRYGAFASYRQLFETRTEKREAALTPTVDAEDPVGTFIGSLVIRGPSATRLGCHVEGALKAPTTLHDDAPEFAVPVAVTTLERDAYAEATTRMLKTKNIRPTPAAITLFQTFASSPYAVAEAIRWLGTEDQPRQVRLDEVRVALSNLDVTQLLGDVPPTASKAVAALLTATAPLSQSDLADAADVSTRSLRRHLDTLVALDLVRETDGEYRIALPFSEMERGERIIPEAVDSEDSAQDVFFEVALATVARDEAGRLGDPNDSLGALFFGPHISSEDLAALSTDYPGLKPWFETVKHLCNEPVTRSRTVTMGPAVEQASLQATTTGGVTA